MLAAVNILSEQGAVNSRLHLVHFGKGIAMRLLQLWKGSKTDILKMEMVKFFRLQLILADGDPDRQSDDAECDGQVGPLEGKTRNVTL